MFRQLTQVLETTEDLNEFVTTGKKILWAFPLIAPWFNWWMRPEHASMLFESQRRMEPALWDALPETTNAEEAMHFKIYKAVDKNHSFMDGMRALLAFLRYFEGQIAGESGKLYSIIATSANHIICSWSEDPLWTSRAVERNC